MPDPESSTFLTTPVCGRLGISVPVVQAPVGSAATSELAAAVGNAGGLGMLAITWLDVAVVVEVIGKTRRLTSAPFAVNACLAFPVHAKVAAALETGVGIVSTFWGDPGQIHDLVADAGAVHLHTVRSPEEAMAAVDAGVDVVVAQGWEAGGHVWGEVASLPLIPAVVDAVDPVPVIAAGGIADGRGLAAVLVLGAQAAWIGTRFLATREASTHPLYQARLQSARATDTSFTTCFDGGWPDAPHRTLRNATLDAWERAGRPPTPDRPGEGDRIATGPGGREFFRYDDMMPLAPLRGDVEEMALYAGQSVGLVHDIRPAAAVVEDLVAGAAACLRGRPPS